MKNDTQIFILIKYNKITGQIVILRFESTLHAVLHNVRTFCLHHIDIFIYLCSVKCYYEGIQRAEYGKYRKGS